MNLFQQCGTNTHQEVEGVSFIRVRVVRVTQTTCGLYGIDNGSFHQCKARDLVLLPASIINLPPCGRLARLPATCPPHSCAFTSLLISGSCTVSGRSLGPAHCPGPKPLTGRHSTSRSLVTSGRIKPANPAFPKGTDMPACQSTFIANCCISSCRPPTEIDRR
ncbi:hypothetical protein E2C01_088327 [Portunus trituberculatus]|uniref:Uncharacterized protein n=1 Tax=Portunus trituberculatus TaxID=210409 RepID=A0A5B7JLM3_PORTR|nr:hypothetical protein [Portunus trituberculatus]